MFRIFFHVRGSYYRCDEWMNARFVNCTSYVFGPPLHNECIFWWTWCNGRAVYLVKREICSTQIVLIFCVREYEKPMGLTSMAIHERTLYLGY